MPELVDGYLGEPGLISMHKTTLRKATPSVPGAWHQDGIVHGDVRSLNLWLSLSRCGDVAPGLDLVPRRLEDIVADGDRRGDARDPGLPGEGRGGRRRAGIVRPIFEPGDALFFDELFLHQTASDPSMPNPRYAIESWFFGGSAFPGDYAPLAVGDARRVASSTRTCTTPRAGATSMAHTAELCFRASTRPAPRLWSRSVRWRATSPACWRIGRRRGRPRHRGRPVAAAVARRARSEHPELELIRAHEPGGAGRDRPADAVVLDGDHNYYTVREELRLIVERAPGAALPLLLFHDVGWPHGAATTTSTQSDPRRPRHPIAGGARGSARATRPRRDGLPYPRSAAREGGERNGVLTAVEDFVADRDGGAPRGRARLLRPRCRSGTAVRRGRRPSRGSSIRGTATRCSRGSRRTVCTTSPQAHARQRARRCERHRRGPGGGPAAAARVERVLGGRAAVAPADTGRRRPRAVRDLEGRGPEGARRLARAQALRHLRRAVEPPQRRGHAPRRGSTSPRAAGVPALRAVRRRASRADVRWLVPPRAQPRPGARALPRLLIRRRRRPTFPRPAMCPRPRGRCPRPDRVRGGRSRAGRRSRPSCRRRAPDRRCRCRSRSRCADARRT